MGPINCAPSPPEQFIKDQHYFLLYDEGLVNLKHVDLKIKVQKWRS